MEEIEQGDYILFSSGKLGSKISVSQYEVGFIGEFSDEEDAVRFCKSKMEKDNWFTNVFFQDDHGGISQIGLSWILVHQRY